MTRPALLLSLLLTACASPRTMDVTLLRHAGEPFVMRDRGSCVLVLRREMGYSELGRMVRECYSTEGM